MLLREQGGEALSRETTGAELLSSVLLILEAKRNLVRLTRRDTPVGTIQGMCYAPGIGCRFLSACRCYIVYLPVEHDTRHLNATLARPGSSPDSFGRANRSIHYE